MYTLLIGYDLNKPLQNYEDLIAAIKEMPAYWHYLDSTWIVRTTQTTAQLRDLLRTKMDENDELLVLDVTGDWWATSGLGKTATDWLNQFVSFTSVPA